MTISNEIQRINTNIENAYSACETKGATLPATQNSANLSTCINSIPEGGSAPKYNLTINNILGDVDSNGNILDVPAGELIATGVKRVDNYMLACKFGGNAWGVTRKQGLSSISFPDLTYIGCGALAYFCTYASDLQTVSFPELIEIDQCGMQYGFQWDTNLKRALFPKLTTLSGMYNSLSQTFYYCQKLEEVDLHSLSSLTSAALAYAFQNCSSLKTLSFDSLNENSFNGYTNVFNNMLSGVSGCTVHFPFILEDIISSWSDVTKGFGGSNTTILFDLKRVGFNFTVTPADSNIYVRGKLVNGTTGYVTPGTSEYLVYNSSLNTLLLGKETDLIADTTRDVSVNLNQTSNKITLNTGISGLEVSFILNGCTFSAVEETSGNYSINYIGESGKTISYFVNGGNNYLDASGTITTTGSNISQSVSLPAATVSTFTRPNLTANGTLGGDAFAVSESGSVSPSGYPAYYAVDSSTSNYWWASANINYFTIYNPDPLKISSIVITYISSSTTYVAKDITVQASNDGSSWTDIYSSTYVEGTTRTLSVNSSKFYKYYRLVMPVYSVYLRVTDIAISGTYKR